MKYNTRFDISKTNLYNDNIRKTNVYIDKAIKMPLAGRLHRDLCTAVKEHRGRQDKMPKTAPKLLQSSEKSSLKEVKKRPECWKQ